MGYYSRVRDLREDHDKTQTDIAKLLNMQLTVYHHYERGERELPLWAAIKLADYYKVSLDYLVDRNTSSLNNKYTRFVRLPDTNRFFVSYLLNSYTVKGALFKSRGHLLP